MTRLRTYMFSTCELARTGLVAGVLADPALFAVDDTLFIIRLSTAELLLRLAAVAASILRDGTRRARARMTSFLACMVPASEYTVAFSTTRKVDSGYSGVLRRTRARTEERDLLLATMTRRLRRDGTRRTRAGMADKRTFVAASTPS